MSAQQNSVDAKKIVAKEEVNGNSATENAAGDGAEQQKKVVANPAAVQSVVPQSLLAKLTPTSRQQ